MCNLCCQNDTSEKLYLVTLILKISFSGPLYANYPVLLIGRNNIESYQILALLIETQ